MGKGKATRWLAAKGNLSSLFLWLCTSLNRAEKKIRMEEEALKRNEFAR